MDNLLATACAPLAWSANFFVVKSRKLLSRFGYSSVGAARTPGGDHRLDGARVGGLHEVVMEPGLDRARHILVDHDKKSIRTKNPGVQGRE